LPIEVKVHRDRRGDPVPTGFEQLDQYMARLGLQAGWLVVFDQRTGAGEPDPVAEEQTLASGRTVTIIRA